tara:strand:+ start:295 stop:582 length:288 start_codon:yes stop_codon:yes gene_type:complete
MDLGENPTLTEAVDTTTPMKEWLVEYVGTQHNPDNEDVTVEMILETMATEFPEFLIAIAEENWIRGYHQALSDVTQSQMDYEAELKKQQENESSN